MTIPHSITDRSCTVYLDGAPYTVDRSTLTFTKLVEVLSAGDVLDKETAVRGILDGYGLELKAMEKSNEGRVTVTRREVLFDGERINDALSRRILDIQAVGLPIDPWVAFTQNLYANPAEYARNELYLWLESADLPITDDGCFLAYKKVKDNFKDIHTGTFDNSPGTVVTMPGGRLAVDPIRANTCSTGLHFCSKDYLPEFGAGYGNKVVLVKINPADVVSIPIDYNNTKGRTWKYEVLSEVTDWQDRKWEPIVANDGNPFNVDPFGNPIPEQQLEEEVFTDSRGREYTIGIYPEDVVAHIGYDIPIVYPEWVGEEVKLYVGGHFDFLNEEDEW